MLRFIMPLDSNEEYDPEREFVTYTVQNRGEDQSRFLVMQYQTDNRLPEQFVLVRLALMQMPEVNQNTLFPHDENQQYQHTYNIVSREEMIEILQRDGSAHHQNLVPIEYLSRVRNIFETTGIIREGGTVRALNFLCQPVRELTGLEINPVELALLVVERIAEKKAEARCLVL